MDPSRTSSTGPVAASTSRASRVPRGSSRTREPTIARTSSGTGSRSAGDGTPVATSWRAISSANSALPRAASWTRPRTDHDSAGPSRRRITWWSAATVSGPSSRLVAGGPRRSRWSGSGVPDRWATRSPTRSAPSRRIAKAMTSAEDASSHWTSSMATSTGASAASRPSNDRSAVASVRAGTSPTRRLRPQQRDVDRVALRDGEPVERLGRHLLEDVADRRQRDAGLGLAGAAAQHPEAALASPVDGCCPDRGLADPGLAPDPERREALPRRRRGTARPPRAHGRGR